MINQFLAEASIAQLIGGVLLAAVVFLVFKAIIGGNGNGKNDGGNTGGGAK